MFQEKYGKKDPACVVEVKRVYNELELQVSGMIFKFTNATFEFLNPNDTVLLEEPLRVLFYSVSDLSFTCELLIDSIVCFQKVFEDYERDSYVKLIADIEKLDDQALQVSNLTLHASHYLFSAHCWLPFSFDLASTDLLSLTQVVLKSFLAKIYKREK